MNGNEKIGDFVSETLCETHCESQCYLLHLLLWMCLVKKKRFWTQAGFLVSPLESESMAGNSVPEKTETETATSVEIVKDSETSKESEDNLQVSLFWK